jgi:hypothetical protein
MDNKVTDTVLSIIRINKQLKRLTAQLDKLTSHLTDKNFWESLQKQEVADLSPEDYD